VHAQPIQLLTFVGALLVHGCDEGGGGGGASVTGAPLVPVLATHCTQYTVAQFVPATRTALAVLTIVPGGHIVAACVDDVKPMPDAHVHGASVGAEVGGVDEQE